MSTDERNPYSPPTAAVADISTERSLERPVAVVRAVKLLWVTFAISVLSTIAGLLLLPTQEAGGSFGVVIIVLLVALGVAFAICYWIYGAIHAGRNWARVLLLVFMIIGVLSVVAIGAMLVIARQMPTVGGLDAIVTTVQWVLTGYATFLLFTPPANAWFRVMKELRT